MKNLILTLLLTFPGWLYGQEWIPLWEGNMPNSKGIPLTDSVENGRWYRVAVPGYYHFRPPLEENKGAAVVICPSGGYGHLTYEIAGFQLAKWFNTMGISAFVLINRLPHSPDLIDRRIGPLQDAQRLMKIIRTHASEWKIDPNRVGAMGCSAGGHLAALLSTYGEDAACVGDRYDAAPVCPDFTVLVSSVITMDDGYTHKGSVRNLLGENPSEEDIDRFSCEKQVRAFTPPAFLIHADDDRAVAPWNSVLYYSALKAAGIPASLHIFPQGGHSLSLRDNPGSARHWTTLCESWLYEMKMIE